jgi:hypothetical protein
LTIRDGSFAYDLDRLAQTDLWSLPLGDGERTAEDHLLEVLRLRLGDDGGPCDFQRRAGDAGTAGVERTYGLARVRAMQAGMLFKLYGGQPTDYLPMLSRAATWELMPHFLEAQHRGHPDPLRYVTDHLGEAPLCDV